MLEVDEVVSETKAGEPVEPSLEIANGILGERGKRADCPVVAVGASAGGLEAYQAFLPAIKRGDGICYVLVQHLDPHHDSKLAELLERHCAVPVVTITDGMKAEPDKVLVIAENTSLTIQDGIIHTHALEQPRTVRRPI